MDNEEKSYEKAREEAQQAPGEGAAREGQGSDEEAETERADK
jgi:hypothetical protein